MSRARGARRIATAAAFGGGGIASLGLAGLGLILAEVEFARRWIGAPFGLEGPDASGVYGAGPGRPLRMGMLGDSSAVGLGVDDPRQTPGAVIAAGLASLSGRQVHLNVGAVVGAESRHLNAQVDRLLADWPDLDVVVIMIGGNDVTHRVRPADSVRALINTVTRLRGAGAEVVVGTCPDLGTIEPLGQPLRGLARRWSRQLAAAQTVGVVEAGGRTVSLGGLLGAEFAARPEEMFSADHFHPSAAGYARSAAALLPSVCAALGILPEAAASQRPDLRRGEGLDDVAHAASRAASTPGTEVAGAEIGGTTRGPRGRWAVLLRRAGVPTVIQLPLVGRRENESSPTASPRPDATS
ncbi:MAG: hydrolase family protein [Actinomycetota bacterium]|nr:hydrolase family protein [Actinomycetota bacterium]